MSDTLWVSAGQRDDSCMFTHMLYWQHHTSCFCLCDTQTPNRVFRVFPITADKTDPLSWTHEDFLRPAELSSAALKDLLTSGKSPLSHVSLHLCGHTLQLRRRIYFERISEKETESELLFPFSVECLHHSVGFVIFSLLVFSLSLNKLSKSKTQVEGEGDAAALKMQIQCLWSFYWFMRRTEQKYNLPQSDNISFFNL